MKALIKYGASGVDVMEIQTALVRFKQMSPGDCDGQFGPYTENAVRRFQKENGLVVDGCVGPITWAALMPKYAAAESLRRSTTNPAIYMFLNVCRKYIGMREDDGPNRSKLIDAWVRELGLEPSDRLSWCLIAIQHHVKETCDILSIKDLLVPNTAGVMDLFNRVPNAWKFGPMDGIAGDLMVMDFGSGHGHIGVIQEYHGGVYETLEWNTNDSGSREGDGGYEKKRKYNVIKGVIRLPWPQTL